jgi:hypothetical protein
MKSTSPPQRVETIQFYLGDLICQKERIFASQNSGSTLQDIVEVEDPHTFSQVFSTISLCHSLQAPGQSLDYDETSVYNRDCGQLVPKPVATTKTDWREESAPRSTKPKSKSLIIKWLRSVPSRPLPGRGNGGHRLPVPVPVVSATVSPIDCQQGRDFMNQLIRPSTDDIGV